MTHDLTVSERLDDDGEAFLRNQWALLEGPDGGMAQSKGIAVTAQDNGEIVGVAKGWCSGGIGYVTELMVTSTQRKSGIGAKLLHEFGAQAREYSARWLALRVEKESPAVEFYLHEGWTVELEVNDWLDGHAYLQLRKPVEA